MNQDQLSAVIEPIVAGRGLDLYDIEQHGNRLAVLVSRADGVGIDDLSEVSRAVSVALDEADPMPGAYTLEVSSPGVERRLRRPDHFEGAVGETVTVRTVPGPEGRQRIQGELVAADAVSITIDDPDAGRVEVAHTEIEKARTVFEWGPAPKPGRGSAPQGRDEGRRR